MTQVVSIRAPKAAVSSAASSGATTSQQVLRRSRANELFIAVVGPAGAGAGTAAEVLKGYLEKATVNEVAFEVAIIKASNEIKEWASQNGLPLPPDGQRKTLDSIITMQDRGDGMRSVTNDNAAVAKAVIKRIRQARAEMSGKIPEELDGRPRAYIIDSLRHPAEANLLRRLYQDAFALVGIVCDRPNRERRLTHNLFEPRDRNRPETKASVADFMDRDADAPEKHGQHVTDTFHEADFFVDNSDDASDNLSMTAMNEPLRRFVNLMTSGQVVRPTIAETAMHHAHSAQLRSACMSRQVGAALTDGQGNIISTGTNEVPKAGGGVYGESFNEEPSNDSRCVFRETKFCSSNKEQNAIINELIDSFPKLLDGLDRESAIQSLRRTKLGGLIEFSRAVHAEMDAILSAARIGVSPRGGRLFVSTFPCHYCARHIVSAGIDEVQYIEPYPKSRALALHDDSITTDEKHWSPPSQLAEIQVNKVEPVSSDGNDRVRKVLFRPFVGVAPKMYERVFLKDRDYKNKISGEFVMGEPEWGKTSDIFSIPYTKLEAELAADAP